MTFYRPRYGWRRVGVLERPGQTCTQCGKQGLNRTHVMGSLHDLCGECYFITQAASSTCPTPCERCLCASAHPEERVNIHICFQADLINEM